MEKLNLASLPHFVGVENLSVEEVEALVKRAEYFKSGGTTLRLTQPAYISNMFFEGSSRTYTNFEMAERKLSLTIIPFDPAHSSVNKGETLYDASLIMDAVGVDIEVIRHSQNEYYQDLICPKKHQYLNIGVANTGDGSGQHPGQCLLDMVTTYGHFGRSKGPKAVIIGDITNSRATKNNMELSTRLGVEVYLPDPEYWYSNGYDKYGKYEKLDKLVPEMDVTILLRVQHERYSDDPNGKDFDAKTYHEEYGINHKHYRELKPDTIIMHPDPINHDVELSRDLVESDKCTLTHWMQNGVLMRMVMIEAVLRGKRLGGLK